jgi:predicted SprT family Zn-dependent metalloprotease
MLPLPPQQLELRARRVAAQARRLMDAHGLHNWSFAYNRRKRSLGVCQFRRRRIELSIHLLEHNPAAEVRDTILHEIAHALVGPGHGHDRVWKEMCRKVGARPERIAHEAHMPPGRWQAGCGACGKVYHRHRRPPRLDGWYCRGCGRKRGSLRWRLAEQAG